MAVGTGSHDTTLPDGPRGPIPANPGDPGLSKRLVIVESPAKAKTIGKYLGAGFHVEASVGHIRDLPTKASELPKSAKGKPWSRLAVDTTNDYKPVYVLTKRGREQVKKLKELLKEHGIEALPEQWATRRPEELKPAEFITLTTDLFGTVDAHVTATASTVGVNQYIWRKAPKV